MGSGTKSGDWSVMILYTDRFIKDGFAGCAIGPAIFIRPKYRDDVGLLEYEKTHVRQFWCDFPLFGLRYRFSRRWRREYEAEAYAAQAKCYPDDQVPALAARLADKYNLGITSEIAERAIREAM